MRDNITKILDDNFKNAGFDLDQDSVHNLLCDLILDLENYIDEEKEDSYNDGFDEGYDKKVEEYESKVTEIKYPVKENIETSLRYLGIKSPNLKDIMKMEWILENWDNIKEDNFSNGGWKEAYDVGYSRGYIEGEINGYEEGYEENGKYESGYTDGWNDGYLEGKNENI